MLPTMTIRVPEELQKYLAEMAKQQGFTRNALVLMILRQYVEDNKAQDGEKMKRKEEILIIFDCLMDAGLVVHGKEIEFQKAIQDGFKKIRFKKYSEKNK